MKTLKLILVGLLFAFVANSQSFSPPGYLDWFNQLNRQDFQWIWNPSSNQYNIIPKGYFKLSNIVYDSTSTNYNQVRVDTKGNFVLGAKAFASVDSTKYATKSFTGQTYLKKSDVTPLSSAIVQPQITSSLRYLVNDSSLNFPLGWYGNGVSGTGLTANSYSTYYIFLYQADHTLNVDSCAYDLTVLASGTSSSSYFATYCNKIYLCSYNPLTYTATKIDSTNTVRGTANCDSGLWMAPSVANTPAKRGFSKNNVFTTGSYYAILISYGHVGNTLTNPSLVYAASFDFGVQEFFAGTNVTTAGKGYTKLSGVLTGQPRGGFGTQSSIDIRNFAAYQFVFWLPTYYNISHL